jgi:hypothetical protein
VLFNISVKDELSCFIEKKVLYNAEKYERDKEIEIKRVTSTSTLSAPSSALRSWEEMPSTFSILER